jgi:hypothetical protein
MCRHAVAGDIDEKAAAGTADGMNSTDPRDHVLGDGQWFISVGGLSLSA